MDRTGPNWTELDRTGPNWTEAYWIQKWARSAPVRSTSDSLRVQRAAVGVRSGPEVGRGGGGEVGPKWARAWARAIITNAYPILTEGFSPTIVTELYPTCPTCCFQSVR